MSDHRSWTVASQAENYERIINCIQFSLEKNPIKKKQTKKDK